MGTPAKFFMSVVHVPGLRRYHHTLVPCGQGCLLTFGGESYSPKYEGKKPWAVSLFFCATSNLIPPPPHLSYMYHNSVSALIFFADRGVASLPVILGVFSLLGLAATALVCGCTKSKIKTDHNTKKK
jgi:hypothetical protein